MIDSDSDIKLVLKSMSPVTRERLVRYFNACRLAKLESVEMANDEIQVRRAQGAALTYKDLAKQFAE